ncbi:DNA polymerase Y family protein [uncultured Methylibium sp.]|uniref:Y-family DNA polymerase n=1 Tax=uncultured Methylibium sp. TaxID=381093 RepID=UPI0025F98C4A|nr:DNA polymerase Y family protein [uncultured Methylibium sp.]
MLWIALHLPQLPLQALPWSQAGLELALPVAVAEPHRLLGANRAARALGVQAGQSVATALALVPQLQVVPRDTDREAALVERLALALAALSPSLSLTDSGLLLEVRASLRLFGGLRPLLRRARQLARDSQLHVRSACAPTAAAAWLLATSGVIRRHRPQARSCTQQLDRLPTDALRALLPLAPRQAELLEALGVQDLGALRALPRAGLQRRLGHELALALDRAYGDAPDPRRWFEPPERFACRRELMQRADRAEVLVAAVQVLLPALIGWLQRRWLAATTLVLRLGHEPSRYDPDRPPDTLLWLQLGTPSRDPEQLALLWRERLQRHALIAPVYEIELVLEAAVPHGGRPGELLPLPGQANDEHAALLDRLVARLGADRVQRWWPVADHRPEQAQRALPTHAALPPPAEVTAMPRPAWLLPAPLPLACDPTLEQPLHDGPLRLCSRAERIEAGWHDGALVRRDYHVAEGRDHRLRWIYREHRPGPAAPASHPGGWFLHGWFG